MNDQQARQTVVTALSDVAPEVEPAELDGSASLRDQADLDSMDFLDLLALISERTRIEVPEDDYGHWETLDGAVEYLVARSD